MAGEEEMINVGAVVRDRWKVIKKLGEGGFGAVFEVFDLQLKESAALKVESAKETHQVLKMEVAVLRRLQGKNHVCKFYGCGRNDKFNYVVMGLVGKNLADLKRDTKEQRFSLGTAVRLIFQCMRGIEDMHSIGFLHRDVKPSNYAMGAGAQNSRTCYVLDFGLARQYVNTRGELRTPRSAAGFRGTVRYASVTCHINKDMGRVDDLWCLFYMLVEFILGQLPWRRMSDKEQVGKLKQSIEVTTLIHGCPDDLFYFHKHLASLRYADTPDYQLLYRILDKVLQDNFIRDDDPYDWEIAARTQVKPRRVQTPESDRKLRILGDDNKDRTDPGEENPWDDPQQGGGGNMHAPKQNHNRRFQ